MFMGSGTFDNEHGVGIVEQNGGGKESSTQSTSTNVPSLPTILVSRQHIKLMSENFHHLKYADPSHWEDVQNNRETHGALCLNTFPSLEKILMLSWDLEKERNVKVSAEILS